MISVLVSCLFNRLDNVKSIVYREIADLEYVIVIQGVPENLKETFDFNFFGDERNDITILLDDNVGVTHSRNLALKNASGDIALFADDDVTLVDNFDILLRAAFKNNPKHHFFTFDIANDDDFSLFKPALSFNEHSLFTILGVGTIQIAIKLDNKTKNYQFPTFLGAGAKLPMCDEPVYVSQFINNNLLGKHIHQVICAHPRVSSGTLLDSKGKLLSRLKAFPLIFGAKKGYLFFLIYLIKNLHNIRFKK